MSESPASEARPYHHGDLRRGLVEAARRLLEREGPAALSLRAVAREAGVSPAAPYHHFKDKSELLDAVADQGWAMLTQSMLDAMTSATGPDQLAPVMLAYVMFAREHPALYRVMYDAARSRESLPIREGSEGNAYERVRESMISRGANPSRLDIELSMAAGWCAAHGLAEMAGFKQFDHLKDELGGELEFLSQVLRYMGLYRPPPQA